MFFGDCFEGGFPTIRRRINSMARFMDAQHIMEVF